MKTVNLAGKEIGKDKHCFIIAEAGINHNGEIQIAKQLISAAKTCGADAVKFQSFQADKICDLDLTETKDVEGITGGSKSSYNMYKELELSEADHLTLFEAARREGIICFTSVFDEERVDFLNKAGAPAFKIASGDITYIPLIKKAARTGRPLLISTGMSNLDEIAAAIDCCRMEGNDNIILLHCTSLYPPPDDEVNLNVIAAIREAFCLPVGYSDHSAGTAIPIAAAAMGANVIEKHFTLDNKMPGPDHVLSLNPVHFGSMVTDIRRVEKAQGSFVKQPTKGERSGLVDGRRGIYAAIDISEGTSITPDMLKIVKPARGLPPVFSQHIEGLKALRQIKKREPITEDLLRGTEELCISRDFVKH